MKQKNRQIEELRSEDEQKIQALYAEVGKRSTQLAWAEKNLQRLRREERIALVDFKEREIPPTFQAKRLGINRSSLYYEPIGPSEDEIRIKHRIERHYPISFFRNPTHDSHATPGEPDHEPETREKIARYLNFYNYERPHQSLNDRTPVTIFHQVI